MLDFQIIVKCDQRAAPRQAETVDVNFRTLKRAEKSMQSLQAEP